MNEQSVFLWILAPYRKQTKIKTLEIDKNGGWWYLIMRFLFDLTPFYFFHLKISKSTHWDQRINDRPYYAHKCVCVCLRACVVALLTALEGSILGLSMAIVMQLRKMMTRTTWSNNLWEIILLHVTRNLQDIIIIVIKWSTRFWSLKINVKKFSHFKQFSTESC